MGGTTRALAALAAAACLALALAQPVQAANDGKIYAGPRTGAYYDSFGPVLKDALAKSFFRYDVSETQGDSETIAKVAADPTAIGLIQADLLANELAAKPELAQKLTVIRADVAQQCLFAVTNQANADRLKSWGDVQSYARRLRLVTGPQTSGAAGSLAHLKRLSEPLQQATIAYQSSVEAALDLVITGAADLAFFVQFPDLTSPRFAKINDAKLIYLPVIDRPLLRVTTLGETRAYLAEDVTVVPPDLINLRAPVKLTTSCTPVAYITGTPEAFPAGSPQQLDARELVERVRALKVSALRPQEGWLKLVLDQAAEVTGAGLESLLQAVDKAAKELHQ